MITQEKELRGLLTAWEESLGFSDDQDLPLLFFLHGFPACPQSYLEQWKFFKDYPIVSPWNRGVGKSISPRNPKRYGLHGHLLDHLQILDEIDKRKKRKVIVIGHDIGSLYSWNLAVHLKDRLQGLVLINGVSPSQMIRRVFNPKQVAKSWYIALFQIPLLAEKFWNRYEKQITSRVFAKGGKPRGLESREAIKMGKAINQYQQAFYECPEHYTSTAVEFPLLSICGKDDPFLEPADETELKKIATNFELEVIEGGHWVHQQNHQLVNQKILEFIQQTSES